MTIEKIISSCLFLLDKDEVVKDLDEMHQLYENHLDAIANNRTQDTELDSEGNEVAIENSINNTLKALNEKISAVESEQKVVVNLKFIANKVLKLISINYLPCVELENINVAGGEFDLKGLSRNFTGIKSIKSLNAKADRERAVDCKVLKDKLIVASGEYELIYNYDIADYDYFDAINDFPLSLTYSTIVDGVLGEYYILNGFYEEADFYITRFETQMATLNRKTREVRLKERVWG